MKTRQLKEQKFWDKFARYYDLFIKKTLGKTYEVILENIDTALYPNQNVLEIGTGTGIIPFTICTKVNSVVATDISPEMILIAKQKQSELHIKNIDFQVQDAYQLSIADHSFDLVIASNILHLLYEPEQPISEIKRVMKDDGIFIAPTFCVGESLKSKIISSIAGALSGFKIVNKWCINDFKSVLIDNGFEIKKFVKVEGRFPLVYVVMKKSS
ncbi:MAG: class I SAM-dependent methyltransferase [Bacteroidetes bacterium]|nr:class I SAM-dependent methyltransferase [Bacteroidota bacterium]